MRLTVRELVQRKKDELHQGITVPNAQFVSETDRLIAQTDGGESLAQRYSRLASESEHLYRNLSDAENFSLKL